VAVAFETPIARFDPAAPEHAYGRAELAGWALRAPARTSAPATPTLETVRALARRYPASLRAEQLADAARIASHVERILRPGASVADLGGGVGLFSPTCAALGMQTWLVDDFGDPVNRSFDLDAIGVHRPLGVRVIETPIHRWGEAFGDESLDVVTCFDSLEHWHHSPRPVFAEAWRALKPGGTLLISGPNAVNLRKRLSVPFGRSNWSQFEDWYYPDQFRGHVREPVLGDLVRLVRELGFERQATWGRNWAGYPAAGARRVAGWLIDRSLRPFPTLCSDLYVMARKPD
jgi:SAM-dependent methyltransferase